MNKKIRVIHLAENLNVGGAEYVMTMIARGLDKKKYYVEVWGIARGGSMVNILQAQGTVVKILGIFSYSNPFNILKLAKFFKDFQPDIIHSHTYFSNTISRLAAKLAGVPTMVVHVHSIYSQYTARHLWVERFLSRWTTKVISCSDAVRQFVLQKEKINPSLTTTIPNGVDVQKFSNIEDNSSLRHELNIKSDDIVLTTIASLTPQKGHRYFLEALTEIIKINQNVKYFLIGDGPLRKELEEYVEKLGLGKYVQFLGIRHDVPLLLKISNIFILPSLREGLPLVIIEAMASGLPVIATDVGGTSEVVKEGVTGLLVPAKDVQKLIDAVVTLFNNPVDVKVMGEQGRKRAVKYFSQDIMLKQIEKIYQGCLSFK
ncbi:hypothetical protein MNBD_UNCLBAC01-2034 [hydrothermal vent metagenome]|uniref:Glycosyltransferase n=1 Tax=hydrothermal vent metagenome TaxID=652676 RepID=A0A3B1E5S5_9ZZZZ